MAWFWYLRKNGSRIERAPSELAPSTLIECAARLASGTCGKFPLDSICRSLNRRLVL